MLFRWSKLGNVLFLESPAGVGFSYCQDGTECVHTDESAAADAADFFRVFYERYPELKSNDLYLTGESYAGAIGMRMDVGCVVIVPHSGCKLQATAAMPCT